VEIQYRNLKQATTGMKNGKSTENSASIFLGWTGMPSARRLGPVVVGAGGRLASNDFEEAAVVEIDATFGRVIGLVDKQKVRQFFP
jgi:peroxin-1